MKSRISEEELRTIVNKCTSVRQVLISMNLVPKGGNYNILKNRIESLNIDTTHFTGKGWRRGKEFGIERMSIRDILIKDSRYSTGSPRQSSKIKNLLFRLGIKDKRCEECGILNWMNKDIGFELHHIDGDSLNNEINNLKILCPNCHSQTSNFRGRR